MQPFRRKPNWPKIPFPNSSATEISDNWNWLLNTMIVVQRYYCSKDRKQEIARKFRTFGQPWPNRFAGILARLELSEFAQASREPTAATEHWKWESMPNCVFGDQFKREDWALFFCEAEIWRLPHEDFETSLAISVGWFLKSGKISRSTLIVSLQKNCLRAFSELCFSKKCLKAFLNIFSWKQMSRGTQKNSFRGTGAIVPLLPLCYALSRSGSRSKFKGGPKPFLSKKVFLGPTAQNHH